jgi:protein TonB
VFSRDVLGMPASLVSERWRRIGASGGSAPPALATDREVLAYVRLKPGAIGYVSLDADVQGVKVVPVGGKAEAAAPAGGGIAPIPVQGNAMPERIFHVQPQYPTIARSARVQGTVTVEVIVGPSGTVEQARVVRSIPALDDAAVAAVRQWKYKPTVVNGAAVPVTMLVHVAFGL